MSADRLFGLAFMALAVGIFIAINNIEVAFSSQGDPGAKLLPYFLSAGLGLLGLLLVLRRRPPDAVETKEELSEEENKSGSVEMLAPPSRLVQLALAAALIAYVALFERLGFTFATFLFLAVAMGLLAPRTLRAAATTLALAAGLTFAVGGFLVGVVGMPLPGVWMP